MEPTSPNIGPTTGDGSVRKGPSSYYGPCLTARCTVTVTMEGIGQLPLNRNRRYSTTAKTTPSCTSVVHQKEFTDTNELSGENIIDRIIKSFIADPCSMIGCEYG
jgi:hypothetical protein